MNLQFNIDMPRRSTYSDLVIISSDDEEMSDGVSVISTDDEEMVDVETQMMALNVEAQMAEPKDIPQRRMTMGHYDPNAPSNSVQYYLNMLEPTSSRDLRLPEGRPNTPESFATVRPINNCSNLLPFIESPQSPPDFERGFMNESLDDLAATPTNSSVAQIPVLLMTHVGNLPQETAQTNNGAAHGYFTDCLVCGKPYEQITDELVIDYIHKTEYPGESAVNKEARRLAYLEGMKAGTFLLIPRGLSQAAACDGNVYSIPQGAMITRALPNTLPLL